MHLLKGLTTEGFLGLPKAAPVHLTYIPDTFVPYNCLKYYPNRHIGVHFFIHDYRFTRVWSHLEETLRSLAKYDVVIATDDSLFLDVPLIANLRNLYKNRLFTAVGQRMGLTVIPSFSCGNPKDINLYCDGLPQGGCIAVGGMGTNKSPANRIIYEYCLREMCKQKRPDLLLLYGGDPPSGVDVPIYKIPTFIEKFQ